MSLPHVDDIRTIPQVMAAILALRDDAVANQHFQAAVVWREMHELVAAYNDQEKCVATECVQKLSNNIRLLALALQRIVDSAN